MHVQVYQEVATTLRQDIAAVERDRNIFLGFQSRSFIYEAVLESLNERGGEWQNLHQVNPDNAGAAAEIAQIVHNSVMQLLNGGPITERPGGGQNTILLIDILQSIYAQWCGIFPFCR